jgi:uncharacterized protein HemX
MHITPFTPYAAVGLLAILLGLGGGYYFWGTRAADLNQEMERERSEHNYRLAEMEQRVKGAEERARQETEARRVLEDELHRVRPLK